MIVVIDPSNYPNAESSFISFLEEIATGHTITTDITKLDQANAIIIYSIEHSAKLLEFMAEYDLVTLLKERARKNIPFLGISNGMQILFSSIYDDQYYQGLNLISGHITKCEQNAENQKEQLLTFQLPYSIFKKETDGYCYTEKFISIDHYNTEDIVATYSENQDAVAIVARNNIVGMLFQPELSKQLGTTLMQEFLATIS